MARQPRDIHLAKARHLTWLDLALDPYRTVAPTRRGFRAPLFIALRLYPEPRSPGAKSISHNGFMIACEFVFPRGRSRELFRTIIFRIVGRNHSQRNRLSSDDSVCNELVNEHDRGKLQNTVTRKARPTYVEIIPVIVMPSSTMKGV